MGESNRLAKKLSTFIFFLLKNCLSLIFFPPMVGRPCLTFLPLARSIHMAWWMTWATAACVLPRLDTSSVTGRAMQPPSIFFLLAHESPESKRRLHFFSLGAARGRARVQEPAIHPIATVLFFSCCSS
jgi:hypothetical protein